MALTVHHLQCSQSERIVWLCEELSIPYKLQLYKRDPVLCPPDLAALHPMRAAPVIEDTTTSPTVLLGESAAIVEYIIHKHGGSRLALPPSHANYADYLYWFHFANGGLQPTLARNAITSLLPLPADNPLRASMNERQTIALRMLDDRLRAVPWLAGEEFSAADVMSVFSLTTMRYFSPFDLSGYDGILGYLQRVEKRETYRRAMEKGDPGMKLALGAEPPELFEGFKALAGKA